MSQSPSISSPRKAVGRWLTGALLLLSFPALAGAKDAESKFTFNAYFTLAYADADGAPIFGIPEDGTFDYLTGAALINYRPTEKDRFALQLATERLGDSPLNDLRDDIEIDWLFYEHVFSTGTEVKLGRVPVPYGIYNELRDVGTLLEFYRPPVGIYFEGAFSSESIDGIVLSQRIFRTDNWALDVDGYYGEWDRAEYIPPIVYDGKAEKAHGLQFWLETPIAGLRIGAAAQRFDQTGGWDLIRLPGESTRFDLTLFSVDADFGRFFARAERQLIKTDFGFLGNAEIPAYYGMAGFRVTDSFQVNVMYESSKNEGELFSLDPLYEDLGASLIYRFNQKFLARVEYHQFDTNAADVPTPVDQPEVNTDILIVSISAAF